MNPAKFQLDDNHQPHSRRDQIMNGNRPSPLKINKGSYLIHKPSNSVPRMDMAANKMQGQQQQQQYHPHHHYEQQQRQPVIIYTQSPKVIHTQARDFMALVQKLTGLSPSPQNDDRDQTASHQTQHTDVTTDDHAKVNGSSSHGRPNHDIDHIYNNNVTKSISGSHDENDQSSSGLTDENCGGNCENENKNVLHQGNSSSSAGYSPNAMFSHPSPYFADIPLFTPTSNSNSTDFFCSPRPLYRFPDSSSLASPNVGGSMSPSMFKFIKGLPEY